MQDFEGCLHLGGESLDGFARLRGEKAVDMHEPLDTEVQVSVIAGGWWRLPGAARSNS